MQGGQPIIVNSNPRYYGRGFIPQRQVRVVPVVPNYNYPPQQQPINAANAVCQVIEEEVFAEGEPQVIEEALFRGEVVGSINKSEQQISTEEAILNSEGYASNDGKNWKKISSVKMNIFQLGKLPIERMSKLKAKYVSSLQGHKTLKITLDENNYFVGFRTDHFDQWFLRIIWAKMLIMKKQCEFLEEDISQMKGKIFKKSQILGEWEPRYVIISNTHGLQSFKNDSKSPSLQIKSTNQIWTRFQNLNKGVYLIVKLWHSIIKEQFAIPIWECLGWLKMFLKLLKQ